MWVAIADAKRRLYHGPARRCAPWCNFVPCGLSKASFDNRAAAVIALKASGRGSSRNKRHACGASNKEHGGKMGAAAPQRDQWAVRLDFG